jgi:hypothetical protein
MVCHAMPTFAVKTTEQQQAFGRVLASNVNNLASGDDCRFKSIGKYSQLKY